MKKIINNAENFVEETVRGIVAAHGDKVELLNDDFRILIRKDNPKKDKVGIVTGGGSGHLPTFLGYVGEGMLDGCTIGNVFASPSSQKMFDMIKACDFGKGVLCLYGNYGGDKMNFNMACELAEFEDIKTENVLVKDDVASASFDKKDTRRGVAGMLYAYKIAGAAADEGYELEKVADITKRALENIKTIGVALSPCIVPEVGKPTFNIEENKIEIGMGIHGEKGIEVRDMMTANEISDLIFDKLNEELNLQENEEVSVMVNGLGATPLEELYIIYNRIHEILKKKNINIIKPHIGEFATSMEMAGLSITIFKLEEGTKQLLLKTAITPFYTNINK
ncbi:MAG: dihydroxyacetone kinase subunit DhaK [Pseudoleptotrichia goodfellowii]|nr:dihydroxyacetone kinase subunit DhaK [Pseudoleptotrichia goodfellowii]